MTLMDRPYEEVRHLSDEAWEKDLQRCAVYTANEVVLDVSVNLLLHLHEALLMIDLRTDAVELADRRPSRYAVLSFQPSRNSEADSQALAKRVPRRS
jgi:hypothetical protein